MNTDAQTFRTGGPPPLPPSPRSQTRLALAILVVIPTAILIALILAAAVLLARSDPMESARAEVLQTSQRFAVLLTTYNADTLAAQREDVLELAAGRFRTEYTTLTGADFLAALQERQADSKGRVLKIAITSLEGDDAEALALVEVTTKNKDLPTPRVEQNLIELSLVRSGGGWRIAAVSIIGTIG
ncbi:MAG: hypothetical protein WEB06_04425 [Actinomycetota bacterium]